MNINTILAETHLENISIESPENLCRICYNEVKNPIQYCLCKDAVSIVHEECLIKWITMQNIEKCEICNGEFNIEKDYKVNPKLKYLILIVILWIGVLFINIVKFTKFGVFLCLFILLFIITNLLNFSILKNMYILKSLSLLPYYNENTPLLENDRLTISINN